jgi:ferric hydroxamate transport system substrate-binding protein
MNRRGMLTALLGAGAFAATGAFDCARAATSLTSSTSSTPRRVVVLDWVLTEIVLSLGVVPVGIANTQGFAHSYPASDLPASVVDLGLMFQPNMELLVALKPDLIVITPAHATLRESLERIAPTVTLGIHRAVDAPYTAARMETLRLARMLDCEARAATLFAQTDKTLDTARATLAALPAVRTAPLYVVRFLDEAHLRVFGPHSFYGELLAMLGLHNAWQRTTNASAFSTVGIDALGDVPDATLLYLKPLPVLAAKMMKTSPVWHAMPFVTSRRMLVLPDVPRDGGLPSAMYFARSLVGALTDRTTGAA